MGYSVRKIVLTTYAIGIVVGIAGIVVSKLSIGFAIGVAIVVLACSLVVARWLSRVHVPKPAAGSQNWSSRPHDGAVEAGRVETGASCKTELDYLQH